MSDRAVDPNLHTGLCNIYIKHYEKCIAEGFGNDTRSLVLTSRFRCQTSELYMLTHLSKNSFMTRLIHGPCDFIKAKMLRCFDEERMEKCRDNRKFQRKLRKEKAEEEKERLRKLDELNKTE